MSESIWKKWQRYLPTTLVVLLFFTDIQLKMLALAQLDSQKVAIFPGFVDILLHKNLGVVGNIPIPLALVLPITVVIVLGCLYWLKQIWHQQPGLSVSLQFLIAGALGNFVDRAAHGFTTDYLLLLNRSVINLSDILIVLGVIGILLTTHTPSPHNT